MTRVLFERGDEDIHVEDVDAHRREHELAFRQPSGLLEKSRQPIVGVHLQDAETVGFGRRHLDDRQRGGGAAVQVEPQHPRVVHLVDVVARQHDQMAGRLPFDRVEVLVDRIGCPLVPVLADALLRMEDLDELAELVGDNTPAEAQVTGQRERLVLEGDEDLAQPRVDAVAQREIDDAVRPPEVDGGLGALFRQRVEPLANPAREDHNDRVIEHGWAPGPQATPADGTLGT